MPDFDSVLDILVLEWCKSKICAKTIFAFSFPDYDLWMTFWS